MECTAERRGIPVTCTRRLRDLADMGAYKYLNELWQKKQTDVRTLRTFA